MKYQQLKSHYVPLWFVLVKKEIKVRYSKSILGIMWIGLLPFIQTIIIGSVLNTFFTIQNYFIYLYCGLLTWQFFTGSILSMTGSILSNRHLVKKAAFPLLLLPLSSLGTYFYQYIVILSIVVIFSISMGFLTVWQLLLWIIPGLLLLLLFSLGIGLFTSTLQVWKRDIAFLITALFMPWFYATPIIYRIGQIPSSLSQILAWNPLLTPFSLIQSLSGEYAYLPISLMSAHGVIIVLLLLMSLFVFTKRSKQFVDEV